MALNAVNLDKWSFDAQIKALEFQAFVKNWCPGCSVRAEQAYSYADDKHVINIRITLPNDRGSVDMQYPLEGFPSDELKAKLRMLLQ